MPQKTRAELADLLSEKIEDDIEATASADGAADGTTIISNDLLSRFGGNFTPLMAEITSGARDGDQRLVESFEVVSGVPTLTARWAFGGQIVNGVTFRLHRVLPENKNRYVNEALYDLVRYVPAFLQEDIKSGETLRNGHLQWWRDTSTPYDWETIAGTVAKSAVSGLYDRYVLSLTGVASAGTVQQRIALEPELEGVAITFTAKVYGTPGAGVYIRLVQGDDSGTSDALSLTDTWETLTATLTPTDTLSPLYAELVNTSANAILFKEASVMAPTTSRITWVPRSDCYRNLADIRRGPQTTTTKMSAESFVAIRMPSIWGRGYGLYEEGARTHWGIESGYYLRLTGDGYHSALSADTDTVELSDSAADLLAVLAGIRLMRGLSRRIYLSDPDHWNQVRTSLAEELTGIGSVEQRQRPAVRIAPWR